MESLYNIVGAALVWAVIALLFFLLVALIFLFILEQWRNLLRRYGISDYWRYYRGQTYNTELLREAYKYPHWGTFHRRALLLFRLRNIRTSRPELFTKKC